MIGRRFTERMADGKARALRARNNGHGKAHKSWHVSDRARREQEKDTRADEFAYLRLRHIQQLAALEIFHNLPAKRAVEEFCRASEERRNSGTEVPF